MLGSIFQGFSLFDIWGPIWLSLCIAIVYLYKNYIINSREYTLRTSQVKFFYTGIILLYILHGSPFSIIADYYLFSAFMLQMAITSFIAVPLIVIGLPFKLFKKYVWNYKLRLFIKVVGHPWVALLIFSMLFTLYFTPGVFNIVHGSKALSLLYNFVLFMYAFFMWWAIINPVRRLNELGPLLRIVYIFLASLALMPIGFYLLLVLKAHYPIYQEVVGDILPMMTAVYDQQLAGGLLKCIQLSSFGFVMYKTLRHWGWREEDEGAAYNKNDRYVQGIVIRKDDKE